MKPRVPAEPRGNGFPSKLALGLVFALLGVLLLVAGGGLASHLRVM